MTSAEVSDADDQPDLLIDRRRADDVAGLEILRGAAGVGGRDADDRADADARRARSASPVQPSATKIGAGQDQRRDRHARDRVRRGADEAGDARRDGHEEEAEDDDEQRREEVALRRHASARSPGTTPSSERAAEHDDQREVALGAQPSPPADWPAPKSFMLSRNDETMVGIVRHEGDDAGGEHGAGADVADVGAPQLLRAHLGSMRRPLAGTGGNGTGHVAAQDRQQRQQHQPRQHAAGEHRRRRSAAR